MLGFILNKKTKRRRDLFAALDIGSSKICCAIARLDGKSREDDMRILGSGCQSSQGIKNGVITNLEALEDSILNAVHSAEQMAQETISEVHVNIAGSCVQSHTVDVEIDLQGVPVDERHIRQLIALGRANVGKNAGQIVHIRPITYAIDQEVGIKDPRGLYGQKLLASLHVVSATAGAMQNIQNCISRCHLDVAGFVVSPYASGLATLVEDELSLGVTVVDVGSSNVSIACFLDGSLVHVDSVPIGGGHITSDIARGLSTPLAQAERLKTLYGTIIMSSSDDRETIMVPQLGDGGRTSTHPVSKALLTHVIKARTDEILDLTWRALQQSGIDRIVGQRLVLTGGCSLLPGLRESAAQRWHKQIRIGYPIGFSGGGDIVSTPMFATCGGILRYAMREYLGDTQVLPLTTQSNTTIVGKVMGWIHENF